MITIIKRKLSFAIIAASFAISVTPAQAQDMHFIMCGSQERDADKEVIAAFEAEHEGVKVKMEAVPWGTCQDKSITLAAAGNPPSVAYMGSRTLRKLADNGMIAPASISEDMMPLYQPGVLSTVVYNDQHWGYPHAFSTKALYMNCDLIESAGAACEAPATWDDMYNLAKQVVDNTDAAGIGLAGKSFDSTMHQFLNYLYSNGGRVLDPETGEVVLDSKETRETLEFYGKLVSVAQDGPTAWERGQLRELFNDGKVAMYITGPWGRTKHREEINQKIVPIPAGPSGVSGSILVTDSIVVFKGSGHEELAQKLAQALTSGEAQYNLDSGWNLTPILQYEKAGIDEPYYKNDDVWSVFTAPISTGGPEPLVEDYKSLQGVFTDMMQGIILGDDTVDNLVAIAAEELEELL